MRDTYVVFSGALNMIGIAKLKDSYLGVVSS